MKMSPKAIGLAPLLISLAICPASAQARDVEYFLPIQDVIEKGVAKKMLRNDIKLYFADQPHPAIKYTLDEEPVITFKKGSLIGRTDEEGCNLTMLTTLVNLQEKARRRGGNAVINIESFFKKSFRSVDQYECHAGSSRASVVLRGYVVTLEN